METALNRIIVRILSQMQHDKIDVNSILPNIDALSSEELDRWVKEAENIFRGNAKYMNLVNDLYNAWSVSLILNCDTFTSKDFGTAYNAICFLKQRSYAGIPEIFYRLIEKATTSFDSWKHVIKLWKITKNLREYIGDEKVSILMGLIRSRFDFICRDCAKEHPKNVLLLLAKLEIADEVDVSDLVEFTMKLSLEQLEKESREEIEELLRIIDSIDANRYIKCNTVWEKQYLWNMLEEIDNNQNEEPVRNPEHDEPEIYSKNEIDEDVPLDRDKISQEILLPFKYVKGCLEVLISQGVLDNEDRVCIKYFIVSSLEHSELFDKEKELTKSLSERHPCFLKYYGWFARILSEDSQKKSAYAIVTEHYKTTLIEDIMIHSKSQLKYSLHWFRDSAKDLLEAFNYLEKSEIPHFDIRPHNILVTDDNRLKISGFNFSEMELVSISNNLIEEVEKIWTDSYAAPEMKDAQRLDIHDTSSVMRAGVFSLGLVLLQIYSLCRIAELNDIEFHEEIDDYVSTFKPNLVARLLRKMLKLDKNKRKSFFDSLQLLILPDEEKKEEYYQIKKIVKNLKKIDSNALKRYKKHQYPKEAENGLQIIFKKGKYNNEKVLIRIFKNKEPEKLLPFLEEAEMLEKLDGKDPTFIKYYGLEWIKNKKTSLYSLSLITELCERSLMNDINLRAQGEQNIYYSEEQLKEYFSMLLNGFIALKNNGYYHDNIKPNVILFNKSSELKISGFITPKYKIESCCIFSSESSQLPEKAPVSSKKCRSREEGRSYDNEKSDVYSLGLLFLQMLTLKSVENWSFEKDLSSMPEIKYSRLVKRMLLKEPSWRPRFQEAYDEMQKYVRGYDANIIKPIEFHH